MKIIIRRNIKADEELKENEDERKRTKNKLTKKENTKEERFIINVVTMR